MSKTFKTSYKSFMAGQGNGGGRLGQRFFVLLGLLALSVVSLQGGRFLAPESTVVLVAGVPGDVENETAYREQLQAWVRLGQEVGKASRIMVLTDSPDLLGPPGPNALVLKADRNTFLGLKTNLQGAGPVTLIAWGHGGRQGSTPVFHVRGPRLTPGDFAEVADSLGARASNWVLFFRGSGAFAARLNGEHRRVLSSERETMFGGDPVGSQLFLKVMQREPQLSFDDAARRLGRATAAWYEERHLARTEEPTLWSPGQEPVLLAEDGAAVEAADHRSKSSEGAGAQASDLGAAVPADSSAAAVADSAELPPAWKALKRAGAGEFPGAPAVLLKQRVSYTLGSSPAVSTDTEEYIQILTAEGKRFGDYDISYAPPFEELSFEDCEVLSPDGKLSRLEPDSVREALDGSMGEYQVGRRKVFSLPGVVPGAIVHVRYRSQWKDFPLPHISMELPVSHSLPAVDTMLQVSVPKTAAFHYAAEYVTAPNPKVTQSPYGSTYTWNFQNVPAYRRELLVPPRQRPRLLISTFRDWKDFSEWYSRIIQLADEVTPEIAARAKDLTRNAHTDRDKVLALYNFVTSLRYVAVPMGVNSFRPHAAAHVLENHFGDCKDKANLFNALLRAVNVKSDLVLVPRFSQALESTPGLAFNHAISKVSLPGETLWVDTTDDVCRFGMLPPGDPGRNVLVIDSETAALTQLPQEKPGNHRLRLEGEVRCFDPAEAFPVTLRAAAFGFADYQLRSAARESHDTGTQGPLLATAFKPVAGAFALQSQKSTRVSALDEDFTWEAEGVNVGLASSSGSNCVLHSPFWLPHEWELALHRRQAPLFLNQGYPLVLDERFEFLLPPSSSVLSLPAVCERKSGPLTWRVEWKSAENGRLQAALQAELRSGELSPQDSAAFQGQLRGLLTALGSDAILNFPQITSATKEKYAQ